MGLSVCYIVRTRFGVLVCVGVQQRSTLVVVLNTTPACRVSGAVACGSGRCGAAKGGFCGTARPAVCCTHLRGRACCRGLCTLRLEEIFAVRASV
jgi:hypothetical protein